MKFGRVRASLNKSSGCVREPLNKPESSAIRLLLPLSLLDFPKALRVSRGLVQKFLRDGALIGALLGWSRVERSFADLEYESKGILKVDYLLLSS